MWSSMADGQGAMPSPCKIWAFSLDCCCQIFQVGAPSGGGSAVGAPHEHTWHGSLVGVQFAIPVLHRANRGVLFLTTVWHQTSRLTQA